MYYYVLGADNLINNSIVVAEGTDPALFGAIADERIFAIGDTWYPVPTAQDDDDALLIDHEYRLTLLELGVTGEV